MEASMRTCKEQQAMKPSTEEAQSEMHDLPQPAAQLKLNKSFAKH